MLEQRWQWAFASRGLSAPASLPMARSLLIIVPTKFTFNSHPLEKATGRKDKRLSATRFDISKPAAIDDFLRDLWPDKVTLIIRTSWGNSDEQKVKELKTAKGVNLTLVGPRKVHPSPLRSCLSYSLLANPFLFPLLPSSLKRLPTQLTCATVTRIN